ncbi:hypothetical protein B0H11DRAFT_2227068 [Mycena galericulata]|nr:hypothetical protein B0H11DRAFT_2227068 [Mycena galericulata]
MDTNLCRDLVRYIPVWNPDWEDKVPALVSEEEFLASLMGSVSKITYDDPYVWNSLTAELIERMVYAQRPPSPSKVSMGQGERGVDLDTSFFSSVLLLAAPIVSIDSSYVCRQRCKCDCHKKCLAKL